MLVNGGKSCFFSHTMSFLLFRSHVSSHLFLPLGFAGNVRPPEEAAQFALISPGEGDQGVLGNPQPEG